MIVSIVKNSRIILPFILGLMVFSSGSLVAQNYFHPLSGVQSYTLSPGVYNYYDNGGPGNPYSPNINNSTISFEPQDGCRMIIEFVYVEIEDNASFCGGECCDLLTQSTIPVCGDLQVSIDHCGSEGYSKGTLCNESFVNFTFRSDDTVEEAGWHIRIYVEKKDPEHVLCLDNAICPDLKFIDCDGWVGQKTDEIEVENAENSVGSVLEEFYCWGFGPCIGYIDYYPGCDNDFHPGIEAVYYVTLDADKDLVMSCECFTDVYAISASGCSCLKFSLVGDQFELKDLPAGDYYIVAEVDCGGDICSCDLQFSCTDPGPGELDCSAAEQISCWESIYSSNSQNDGGVSNERDYCGFGPLWTSRERVYTFYATTTGLVSISLSGLSSNLDLFVLSGCNPDDCIAYSMKSGSLSESITINVVKGNVYTIVIDGKAQNISDYLLEVQCTELNCPECGSCFTYAYEVQGKQSDLKCFPKFTDCNSSNYPTVNHSFSWTVDGIQKSTQLAPVLQIPTGKKSQVCQVVKFNNNKIYECCWDITPWPSCKKAPLPYCEITSNPPHYNAKFDGKQSMDVSNYFWEFHDGSNLVSTDTVSVVNHPFTVNSGTTKVCLYGESSEGMGSYCREITPGTGACGATGFLPRFEFDNSGMVVNVMASNQDWVSEYSIDFGDNTKKSGSTFNSESHTYLIPGKYEICVRYTIEYVQSYFDPVTGFHYTLLCKSYGCACFTVNPGCCIQSVDNCDKLKYGYVGQNGELSFLLKHDDPLEEIAGWEINDVPVHGSSENEIVYTFPSAGVYKICAIYRSKVTGCFVRCCKWIDIGDPFDPGYCGGIDFKFVENLGYQFTLTLPISDFENASWTVDSPFEQSLGNGAVSQFLKWSNSPCLEVVVSVRYFDKICKCYRLCCYRLYLCDPQSCGNEISKITQPGPNGSTSLCTNGDYPQTRWYCAETSQWIADGKCIDITNNTCKRYCVYFLDPITNCHRVCCLDINTGIQLPADISRLDVVPNPFSDEFFLDLELSRDVNLNIRMFNSLGQLVSHLRRDMKAGEPDKVSFGGLNLPDGVYWISLEGPNFRHTIKVVKN